MGAPPMVRCLALRARSSLEVHERDRFKYLNVTRFLWKGSTKVDRCFHLVWCFVSFRKQRRRTKLRYLDTTCKPASPIFRSVRAHLLHHASS